MTYRFTSGGIAMTPLRQRMTEDMQLRGLAPATQQAYLRYVEQLVVFVGKSPDLVTDQEFRQFFLALHKERGLSRSTATVAIRVCRRKSRLMPRADGISAGIRSDQHDTVEASGDGRHMP